MHYKISAPNPVSHYIHIEMSIDPGDASTLILKLPSWRPGRYELGNFAKNIQAFNVHDSNGLPLAYRKISKDSWSISTNGAAGVIVSYNYYAAQLDAGACWLDEDQMYVNPVHCFLYLEERMHQPCEIELKLSPEFKVATSLKMSKEFHFIAADFHELVDSPFIASRDLQTKRFVSNGAVFNIWFQGSVNPDWNKILKDFQLFTDLQIRTMGSFPVKEFHYLVQVTPSKFYHGVEHLASTVLAIGPGQQLMDKPLYTDFVGVASHELFHVWNVKTIRPADMLPYDYTRENYSRLGFVYEGVTTYYGDFFLARCGVYSVAEFFEEIGVRIQKHFDNYGRFNMSVADSSFDTWLDGYVPGVPDRKTSIYDEGCITALMTDLLIRQKSGNKNSLDDVMKALYNDFGQKNIGYTEHDYMELVNHLAGESLIDFFMDYVYGVEDDEKNLHACLQTVGCELQRSSNPLVMERDFGFRVKGIAGSVKVSSIAPGSPADKAGLGREDEIIAINGIAANGNLDELLLQSRGKKTELTVVQPLKKLKQINLILNNKEYYPLYKICHDKNASAVSKAAYRLWLNQDFPF